MAKWVECVPNFSEGQNIATIEHITAEILSAPGTRLLHVDRGVDANRTVVTFASNVDTAVEAGFRAISAAADRIDMTCHKGVHKRIGATDVFPFVPLQNTTIDDCVFLAKSLAERVWTELRIPVYLYGKAATSPTRIRVPDIRGAGYETLINRIQTDEFKPDFGGNYLPPKHGATIIGARNFLIAYNINLNTTNVALAKEIAGAVRESGKKLRAENGRFMRDGHGRILRRPGTLKACQADGWLMPMYGMAQVTMNLLSFEQTGLHHAYEAVKAEAAKHGLSTQGSEIIGVVPKSAILEAGRYYTGDGVDQDETLLIDAAVENLGLSAVSTFVPELKIIENIMKCA